MTFDQKIEELRARQEELVGENQSILAQASADKREISKEEKAQIKTNTVEIDELDDEIKTREKVNAQANALQEPQGRKTEADPVPGQRIEADDDDDGALPAARPQANRQQQSEPRRLAPRIETRPPAAGDRGKFGFRFFGEFAQSVVRASASNGAVFDPRLDACIRAAATTYGNESVGEQGGYMVPPDFRTEIMEKVMGEDTLLSRTDQMTTGSNSFTFPKDETTPWQTTGGVQAYWDTEAATIQQSRPALQQETVRLNRLTALVPVTEELLEDAPSIDGYLRRKAPMKMNFKINLAIVQGTGAGQPLGILNSPALVTVDEESGQAADTIVFANVENMWARMYAPARQRAVWLINQDVEPQLNSMSFPGTGTAVPVYLPPGGLSAAPYGTLKGRPLLPTEACNEIGDLGDIVLWDPMSYMTVRRTQGVRVDTSMHLFFDQALTAFRFIFRLGGQPWWAAPIARRSGSNTLSCMVALAARAG